MTKIDYFEIYDDEYFRNYDSGSGIVNYFASMEVIGCLYGLAGEIVPYLRPSTALDVGCASGHFVRALVALGVDAYGIDVSGYAIEHSDPRERCSVGNVVDGLTGWYDMVSCIEVVEHLTQEDAIKAIENMTMVTSAVLFSSTADEERGVYHINMRPLDYWVQEFYRFGFVRDEGFSSRHIPWAVLFRRNNG